MKTVYPTVVIVGRTNVGKSTLFNRLSTDVKSLTYNYQGVTRDVIKDTVCWQNHCFELIDTGGVQLRKSTDPIAEKARQQALNMLDKADLVLFVCDGTVGILPEDREISKVLHKTNKNVLLVVNKIDARLAQEQQYEFERLGHQPVIAVSAQHGTGIADVLESIVEKLPKQLAYKEQESLRCSVVLLGKPNVGKSSLLNRLVDEERAIVAQQPGTTREALSERITFYQEDIRVTDTPGLRRQRGVKEPLESLMVGSTLQAVDNADLVALLVDAHEGRIADQELKLAFYAFERKHKALLVLFNKADLLDEQIEHDLERSLDEYAYLFKKIEKLTISCKTGKNVGRILPLTQKICARYSQQLLPARDLTDILKSALERRPLYHKTVQLKVSWAQQVASAPLTIAMRVNYPEWFGRSQLAFIERVLREQFDLKSVPIKFFVRKKAIV